MHDFFTKDPLSYERAFKQFSLFETLHEEVNVGALSTNSYQKYSDRLKLEDAWNAHLIKVETFDD
jgi:hypothetical protein